MNEHDELSDWRGLSELRTRYRAIQAPPGLSTRILAHAADRFPERRAGLRWLAPATAIAGLAAVVAWAVLLNPPSRQSPGVSWWTSAPALSAIQMPTQPPAGIPSLADLSGVPLTPSQSDVQIDDQGPAEPRSQMPFEPDSLLEENYETVQT